VIQITGFSSTDKVPQVYGQTLTGQGPQSVISQPMTVLCIGVSSASAVNTQNTQVYPVQSTADADNFGQGYQVARMLYAALRIPNANVYGLGVTAASGGVASTAVMSIGGSWNTLGQISYRINGETRVITVLPTDTPATVSANIAADVNSQLRWPVTAASAQLSSTSVYHVTLTDKTLGQGGNQRVLFLNTTNAPSGLVGSLVADYLGTVPALTWQASTSYATGAQTQPTTYNGYWYRATTGGTSGSSSQPTWPTTVGTTVTDGTVTWTCEGTILTGGAITFTLGSGLESYTIALATIINQQYDRIAHGTNDTTNLALTKTQVDAQAGPIANIIGQVVVATNASGALTTLAQTTLNDVRFQVLRELNAETHPCEIAAVFAAARSSLEGSNWAQQYDNYVLPGVAPQSQPADIPNHASLVSDLNNGVTPITTVNGQAVVVRCIVSHSLNGSYADYSTLDTSDLTIPDQIRRDIALYWYSYFKPNNPVCQPDPPVSASGAIAPFPPTGVAMPSTWNQQLVRMLMSYERGDGFPYPQIEQGSTAQNPPQSTFDYVRRCIISSVPVVPMAGNHQLGVSVAGTVMSPPQI
jgi:phage tail sheath gpL-like